MSGCIQGGKTAHRRENRHMAGVFDDTGHGQDGNLPKEK